jgi:hypothetical protein
MERSIGIGELRDVFVRESFASLELINQEVCNRRFRNLRLPYTRRKLVLARYLKSVCFPSGYNAIVTQCWLKRSHKFGIAFS